jgi:NDP-sugar pyrophosphorylase family protein
LRGDPRQPSSPSQILFAGPLGDGSRFGVKLYYIEEPEILGTSGALDNAREYLQNETFIVINGKIICDIDLSAAIQTHRDSKAIATLVLLPNIKRERFTVVETSEGLLRGFGGMPAPAAHENEPAPLMFTGIQILEPRIFDYIPRGVFSHSTTHVYPQAIERGEARRRTRRTGTWYELSTLQRYLDISPRDVGRAGPVSIGRREVRDLGWGVCEPGSALGWRGCGNRCASHACGAC